MAMHQLPQLPQQRLLPHTDLAIIIHTTLVVELLALLLLLLPLPPQPPLLLLPLQPAQGAATMTISTCLDLLQPLPLLLLPLLHQA